MAEQKTAEQHKVGKVIQVIGPALDIEFDEGYLPPIYNAIRIVDNGELGKVPIDVIAEVIVRPAVHEHATEQPCAEPNGDPIKGDRRLARTGNRAARRIDPGVM